MRSHGMSTRPLRRLGTRQQGDSPGHGTCRSPFLEPPAQSISPRAPTTNRKRPVEAAGAVDAKNAPTAPWETGRPAFHSYHRLCLPSLVTGRVSPMFPVNFVTDVPGCTAPLVHDMRTRRRRVGSGTRLWSIDRIVMSTVQVRPEDDEKPASRWNSNYYRQKSRAITPSTPEPPRPTAHVRRQTWVQRTGTCLAALCLAAQVEAVRLSNLLGNISG
jgi:hypothetical protein